MATYFDALTDEFKPLPASLWYVTAHDRFMSGWGAAKDKKNVVVVPVGSHEEANAVIAYMEKRGDMRYIRLRTRPLRNSKSVVYSLCDKWLTLATAEVSR